MDNNVFTAAKPFLTLAKVIGVFPMSFDGHVRKGFLKVKKKNMLISVLTIFLLISLICISQVSPYFLTKLLYFKLSIVAWNVGVQLTTCTVLISFCIQITKCKNVVKLLNCIQNFDMEVSENK